MSVVILYLNNCMIVFYNTIFLCVAYADTNICYMINLHPAPHHFIPTLVHQEIAQDPALRTLDTDSRNKINKETYNKERIKYNLIAEYLLKENTRDEFAYLYNTETVLPKTKQSALVSQLQKRINKLSVGYNLNIDGRLGTKTIMALRDVIHTIIRNDDRLTPSEKHILYLYLNLTATSLKEATKPVFPSIIFGPDGELLPKI